MSSALSRVREDVFYVFVSVYVSDRVKKVGARLARRMAK
jgi:hypothetical protein